MSFKRILLPIGTMIKQYRIVSELGKGGFSITYLAYNLDLKRQVAIKEYIPDQYATRIEGLTVAPSSSQAAETYHWGLDSFLQEAQTLARFSHPNIVSVMDYFQANGTAYLVMPFLKGETLGQQLKRLSGRMMSESQILSILLPVLDGLSAIHKKGVLHRDIKPDNIYIQKNGNPVLIDFGAARNALNQRTMTIVLTPGYAPTEQYYSDPGTQGPWTDIYALGAIIFCCLTGTPPPEARTRQIKLGNKNADPLLPLLQQLSNRVSPKMLEAVTDCLQVVRNQRIQGVAELRHRLKKLPKTTPKLKPNIGDAPAKKHDKDDKNQPVSFSFEPWFNYLIILILAAALIYGLVKA